MASDALVIAVVLVTFGLLFFNQIRVYPLSRSLTSATGAVVVLAIGAISPDEALASVDTSTLLLLFGMLAHVEALSLSGFYGWAGSYLVDYTGTARRLTVGTLVLAAVLSTFALNDATVLLLTPILVKVVRNADVDPIPPLIAVVLGANIGSVATPLGNPQNAYILNRSGLTSVEFVTHLAPVAFVCLFVAALVLVPITTSGVPLPEVPVPDIDEEWALSSLAFLLATFVLLILFPDADPGIIAASMGILHISWLQLFRRVPGEDVLHGMDWSIIVLFVGIFILVGSLEQTSLMSVVGGFGAGWRFAGLTFVLSNLISNVPAVVLLSSGVSGDAGWLVLSAVSTLAGNATPIASAATLIVLQQAARRGVDISIVRLLSVGLPVSILTSAIAVFLLHAGV
ncbi:arsenic resistance protein ArsB [Haladaptatus sp. R4]|uniref:SLC13 family permease n=1 Tax=Haladaptatus sp. R4 TaxID=1679489 RepID=UPI0007B4E168|nr:SLC13 family permease [Haladaptatus sp. R4]KZN26488.1 arsenic resistance protein ArsB [Haladaptatus sp. R4]